MQIYGIRNGIVYRLKNGWLVKATVIFIVKTTDYPTLDSIVEDVFSHPIYFYNKISP